MSSNWSLSDDEISGDHPLSVDQVLSTLKSNCARALDGDYEYPEILLEGIAFDFMALYDFMQRGIIPTAWRN